MKPTELETALQVRESETRRASETDRQTDRDGRQGRETERELYFASVMD